MENIHENAQPFKMKTLIALYCDEWGNQIKGWNN